MNFATPLIIKNATPLEFGVAFILAIFAGN